jgi:hypothetical protein
MRFGLVIVLTFVWATPLQVATASEETSTGNFLLRACKETVRMLDQPKADEDIFQAWQTGFCMGMVQGVVSASPIICTPTDSNAGQWVRIVTKYLEDNPDKLHIKSPKLVEVALTRVFPCR